MRNLLIVLGILCFVAAPVRAQQAASNGLFLVPTAYTQPKGTHSLSSYVLLLWQYSYSLTNTTHISALTYFPVTADLVTQSFTIGIKQQVYRSGNLAVALTGTYQVANELYGVTAVSSIGSEDKSVHVGVGLGGDLIDESAGTLLTFGGRYRTSPKLSWMGEFMTTTSAIGEDEFRGLLTLGIRYHVTESFVADLGGMRPITSIDMGDFLALPVLKVTFEF